MKVILGGTFDPIHNAHLRTAVELRELLDVETVTLVPSHIPPHRDEPGATPEQRLHMLHVAVEGESGLQVDERELARNTPSYTVDTLAELRDELGESVPLAMVVGTDSFAYIDRWHRWKQLLALAHIIVVQRPGHDIPETGVAGQLLAENSGTTANTLKQLPAGKVWPVTLPLLDIAATTIRDHIRKGRSPRYLVPDSVLSLIRETGLYRN
ncbi:nicotinate-nucleotide adenylyltransferase [Marinobacter nanhaiticus D15-8W]|uniref:Probable nicotinate-nucleotide adenylyltransferase n=1 Tax=Marinobacter nanhaiticus D15-8W TaxID=626887 RepID=N6WZ46_9GAMM|nr:nicotinate-nucleotide adenylyltransferase [Marinobacter nanhaiticus]ENO16821.1 nicotinate-nucleotide adenylyltransferase [Marinobacter nanhaiticus D15-8W]BES72637.1 nicotinate-nucleotide adenylyltransferase [Marinobacter nanhaiticus D15-8W]